MSKLVVFGDIHGRTIWNYIIKQENPDKVIFLGDYVSTHEGISPEQQLSNLEDILSYKENNPDKVILLRGNHDETILGYSWAECYPTEPEIAKVMSVDPSKSRFESLTQWIYIDEDLKTIFSHAGVSKVWMENNNIKSVYDINDLKPSEIFGFTSDNYYDMSGYSVSQPPTWIRPSKLQECAVEGWTHVVGHTPQREIRKIISINGGDTIWLCDTLGEGCYLKIENKQFIPVKL